MQAVRASVKPHVVSPETGEVLALEDAVESWIERDARGLILVSGDPGFGRTTAMRHLAAVLPPKPHIRLVDHSELLPEEINAKTIQDLLVITSLSSDGGKARAGKYLLADYRIAGWSFDDMIEYLVHHWPDRCASVVTRLKAADRDRPGESDSLEGCPAAWRAALDRMAEDETIVSPVEALLHEIASLTGLPEILCALQDFCLRIATRRTLTSVSPDIGKDRDRIIRLTAPRGIMQRLAADGIIASLKGAGSLDELSPPLPAPVINQVAALVDDSVDERLRSLLANPESTMFHASAAGILAAADPQWRPEKRAKLNLTLATLDGVQWEGIELTAARLSKASLTNADLNCADLLLAKMDFADLTSSDMREANLTSVDAVQANFFHVDLRGAVIQSAYFTFAILEGANLDAAKLDHTMFRGTNFRQASCRQTSFQECDLKEALVDGADFSRAVFDAADLDGVPLGRANIQGASFYGTSLRQCDFEFINPGSGTDFRKACLMGAHLTGAQLPNAQLAGADLRSTGLADINLEGADLRGALLDMATFHMGSSRSGLVDSVIASEGTRTGFYTDEYEEQHYRDPEEVRKANLCGTDLRGASVNNVDFYLVDLRGARYSMQQRQHFERCGAILD